MQQPAATETHRDWLEPDYFRRSRWLRRLRRLLAGAAVVGALCAVALTLWPGPRTAYQAGPLSPAHAMFNDQCHLCHTESFKTAQRLWPGNAHLASVSDDACIRCHAGPIHHQQQVSTPGCVNCHKEHQGRPQLAHVADGHCISCHSDLQRKDGGPLTIARDIHTFAGHPEFALWRDAAPASPVRLHFNHQAHLKPTGIPGQDGKLVTLNCLSCHELDSDRRAMKPATFEKNCASCHPLSVQLSGQWQDPEAIAAADSYRKQAAPHLKPLEVRAILRDRLLSLAAKEPKLLEPVAPEPPDRLLPGRPWPPAPEKRDAASWVQQELQVSERLLFQGAAGCAYCHIRTGTPEPATRAAGLPSFDPTAIPRRWIKHGEFNHRNHRMLNCADCHPAGDSQKSSDVLIPRIADCQKCHNPKVAAPSNCATCHRYHDRSLETGWLGHFTIPESLGSQRSHP